MELLSANIANADTPGYQARDIDFAKVLSATAKLTLPTSGGSARPVISDPKHIPVGLSDMAGNLPATKAAYRLPTQPSADGNTVDVQIEQAQFADAALHYQASLSFANASIKDLMSALGSQ
jgi:flagellar basal-body rod protein FlgB